MATNTLVQIPGYEGLHSFNKETNNIYNIKRKIYLKCSLTTAKYMFVGLCKNKKERKGFYIGWCSLSIVVFYLK